MKHVCIYQSYKVRLGKTWWLHFVVVVGPDKKTFISNGKYKKNSLKIDLFT